VVARCGAAQGSIAEPAAALKVEMLYHVSNGKREISPAERFSLALRTSCIRSFLMHPNLKRVTLAFLCAMAIRGVDRLSTPAAWAEKSMLMCVRTADRSHHLCVHQSWKAIITSLLLRVIYI
jgi:hypothetical protein